MHMKRRRNASRVTDITQYDNADQITRMYEQANRAPVFPYDPVGNRKSIFDNFSPVAWTTYTYDPKSRLTQDATMGTNTHTYDYTYDGNDNRLTSIETGALATWTYDIANRMVTSVSTGGTTTYAYSPNGNLTTVTDGPADTVIAMSYDKENWLVNHQETVGGDSGLPTQYTYDGDGLKRSEYQSPNPPTTLIWDGTDYLGEV